MPSITVEVVTAKLTAKFGSDHGIEGDGKWSLTTTVKLPWRERLELGTGEKPSEIEMHLTFGHIEPEKVAWVAEHTKGIEDFFKGDDDRVCGLMSYHAAWEDKEGLDSTPASIIFECFTPPDVMSSLIRFAENGRFPKEVRLEVRGLDYGYAPDGSEKRWKDNADQTMLPIVNVNYELPLLEEPEPDYDDDEAKIARAPVTPVGADLAPLLRESMKLQRWALYALAIIASAALYKAWF